MWRQAGPKFVLFAALAVPAAFGQSFSGFTPGNIVVSRSVYMGSASTLPAGQPLPPVCPSTAACKTVAASSSGAYPAVWSNDTIDGSFGITSPVFLDQLTPAGTLVNTLAIPTSMVTTSFSSKSEIALNLSTDGTTITFMGYVAPPNTVDVSNSNTPTAYDPTNPAGGTYYRAVVQVGANGAIQVTPTNSYSGNNGRAAILANGLYYMAGNGNNGAGTPANIVATEGVQLAIPGQSLATPAVPVGPAFSISQIINPATGSPYPPDKLGKDNNFRGLTIFNNTLYVTKGSGGNGINTVYRVGDKGSLPTLANAASVAIAILPGLPATLAKNADAANPFGIFFANANTLYVADEGDGTTANAAGSTNAGLQKWVLNNGAWTRVYVLQNGLNLGQPYTVTDYPTSLNPATDGLRNIAGKVNSDGTVTIWAVTSTISANGDQGADPNKLVSITDVIANTSPTTAASQSFTTLRTAKSGEVLRGVSLTPSAGAAPAINSPLILSAANPGATAIAPGALAIAAGQNLATTTATQVSPYPTIVAGTSISLVDGNGVTLTAPLVSVSPTQIVFLVPSSAAPGIGQVTVTNGGAAQTSGNVDISTVAPGIMTMNGTGLPAGQAVKVAADQSQTIQAVYTSDANGAVVANPIVMANPGNTYLVLYGSGIAAGGTALTSATINGQNATVTYAGPSGSDGVDQVNMLVTAKLAGAGNVNVQVTTEGIPLNPVQVTFK
jgi:uncharacterized protein (TIGR03437 family)